MVDKATIEAAFPWQGTDRIEDIVSELADRVGTQDFHFQSLMDIVSELLRRMKQRQDVMEDRIAELERQDDMEDRIAEYEPLPPPTLRGTFRSLVVAELERRRGAPIGSRQKSRSRSREAAKVLRRADRDARRRARKRRVAWSPPPIADRVAWWPVLPSEVAE